MAESNRVLLLDANLLLLLVIGTLEPHLVVTYKRTRNSFAVEDFYRLSEIVRRADRVVTTPHILAEVSNLANGLMEEQKLEFALTFSTIIQTLEERHTSANVLSQHQLFRFGIADVSMLFAEADLILTEDGRFASLVNKIGKTVALDLQSAFVIQAGLA